MPPTDPKGSRKPCAECRRLKIRCDREVPCSNCTKRGLAKICPNGRLTYGSGRFVLAGTAELHARIQELSIRVRKLEAALEAAYTTTCEGPHPLLRENERIDVSDVEATFDPIEMDPEETEMAGSFSMLAIEDDVRTSRYTPSHYSLWYLDENKGSQRSAVDPHYAESVLVRSGSDKDTPFPIELLRIAQGPYPSEKALNEKLRACLPSVEVGQSLVESYYRVVGVMHDIMPQDLLEEEYWSFKYGCRNLEKCSSLAVIYGIFALGAVFHTALPAGSLSSHQYIQLATLAMSQDSLSISHIEALYLYTIYLCNADNTHTKPWSVLGMTIKLAQTLGIDRECRMWKVPQKDMIRRRRVFNELHSLDCYLSLIVGRTNFLSKGTHNSLIPQPATSLSPLEKAYAWRYLFLGEGVQALLALVLSTTTKPTYEATLALDKKLRAYDSILDPQYLEELGTPPVADTIESKRLRLQQQFTYIAREVTLLHLHRSFLNRAIMNPTGDPILSKWSISVMAAYQSACGIIRQVRLMRDHQPSFLWSIFWQSGVLAAIITLGALVIKASYSSLATVAYHEIQSGCELLRLRFPPGYFLFPVLDKLLAAAKVAYETRDQHPLKSAAFVVPEVRRPLDGPVPSPTMNGNENDVVYESEPVPTNGNGGATRNGNGAASGSTPPAASQEALGSIIDDTMLDSSIFSTAYPLDPNVGGMNWHFLPAPDLNDPVPANDSAGSNGFPFDPANSEAAGWGEFLKELGYV